MEKIYIHGIGEEVPDKISYTDSFETWKSKLGTSVESRVKMMERQNDAYFASLGMAVTGGTPLVAFYAKSAGFANCEARRAAVEEIAALMYAADVAAYRIWFDDTNGR